ncbi:MAG: TIGR03790 family protein [Planctomycetales bacterium]|nr:TIGR03790 family protein [Planctomycetales bacterium]
MGLRYIALSAFIWSLSRALLLAGGGPENVALIVNQASEDSLTLANHYRALRDIPPRNLVYLDWQGDRNQTDFEHLRSEILLPVFRALRERGLEDQIDYFVYSCDFPWRVRAPQWKDKLPPQLAPTASLTGATYLCRLWDVPLDATYQQFFALGNNFYCQSVRADAESIATHAFRSSRHWLPGGEPDSKAGARYLLSMMLGATAPQGNTVEEIIAYLRASAAADGALPQGTIYFMKNGNVRSTTRQPLFPLALRELERLDIGAEQIQGTLPRDAPRVAGLMAGCASFDWNASNSKIVPGAICEHLTSFGGVLSHDTGQTSLCEFLRHGAAVSTGTVCEPYAIQAKFPLPTLHVHYARGCTAAEALYQSVAGPFQLLAVGDPLCRPWARAPTIEVDGIDPGATVSGKLALSPRGKAAAGATAAIDEFQLFLDGLLVGRCAAEGGFAIDTSILPDGQHELRVVGIEATPIATQGRLVLPFSVDNHGRRTTLVFQDPDSNASAGPVVTVQCAGADRVALLANGRVVGTLRGENGELTIEAASLGRGPVAMQAVAYDNRGRSVATSEIVVRDDLQ